MGDLFLLLHLLIYLTISLCQDGLMDIYFLLWVITQHSFIYLIVQTVPALAIGSLAGGSCTPWTRPHQFVLFLVLCVRFLNFWPSKGLKADSVHFLLKEKVFPLPT